ncbi:MAG: MFS transporter [Porticoccaceae bacterium]|nr:MFS transporter [Porticoccaceae bacterium]
MNKLETRSLLGLVALYATRMLGLFMVLPVLTLYGADYTSSTTLLLGVALGIYGLSQGLLQIPLGMLSDKIGRKAVILGGMAVFFVGSLVAATADSIYGLIIGRALQGAGAIASTIMALLADLTTEENRTKAMAAVGGSIGLAFALSMVMGPVVAAHGGLAMIFWLTAALAVVGIALVIFWIPTPQRMSPVALSEALTLPGLFKTTLKNSELLRLDFGVFVLHLVQMASWVAIPFLLQERLQLPLAQHWWLYLLTMGLGFVAMLPLIILGERKRKLKQVFVIAISLLAVAELFLFAADTSFPLFVWGMFVFFVAFNLLEASLPSLVSKITPSGSRGTAMGIYSSSQFLGAFAGGVVGGFIAHNYGYDWVFLLSGAAALIWIAVAATMATPRHWSTLVVDLSDHPHFPLDGATIKELLSGVEEVTCIVDRELMYLKIDRDAFDHRKFEALLNSR